MVERFDGISVPGLTGPQMPGQPTSKADKAAGGGDFKRFFLDSIQEVNRLQSEAEQARVDLATGKSENVAEVFTAVKKAELAFQTLMQIRNRLLEAYDEIKQMRV